MTAVSGMPGTAFGFQFAAVFQPPLTGLVQVMVAAGLGAKGENRSARATPKSRYCWFELAFIQFLRSPVVGDLVLKPAGKELRFWAPVCARTLPGRGRTASRSHPG